jgi:hypothetical protein
VDEGLLREQGNNSQDLLQYLKECGYAHIAAWENLGGWLTSRPLSEGIADLIARYPGGPGQGYLDVAVFSETDSSILNAVRSGCSG